MTDHPSRSPASREDEVLRQRNSVPTSRPSHTSPTSMAAGWQTNNDNIHLGFICTPVTCFLATKKHINYYLRLERDHVFISVSCLLMSRIKARHRLVVYTACLYGPYISSLTSQKSLPCVFDVTNDAILWLKIWGELLLEKRESFFYWRLQLFADGKTRVLIKSLSLLYGSWPWISEWLVWTSRTYGPYLWLVHMRLKQKLLNQFSSKKIIRIVAQRQRKKRLDFGCNLDHVT